MGEGGAEAAIGVADAGPLIHLHEVGRLGLLSVFAAVHVADAVWGEAVAAGRVPEDELTRAAPALQRHAIAADRVSTLIGQRAAEGLQCGELESLALCRELGVAVLLTDDLAAREAAWSIGVRPVGSLGVVVRAHHRGVLSLAEAEEALLRLYTVSSLFVTKAIADLAIEQLRGPRP